MNAEGKVIEKNDKGGQALRKLSHELAERLCNASLLWVANDLMTDAGIADTAAEIEKGLVEFFFAPNNET